MFLVYSEFLGRAICEEGFEQFASVMNFVSVVKKSVEKYRISVARGCFIEYYLSLKIEAGTLYFSAKSRLTTPRFIGCKIKSLIYPESILARDVIACIRSLL